MPRAIARLVLVAVLLNPRAAAAQPPAPLQPCRVADDATYGLTAEQPAQVGGGAAYGPRRQQQYLRGLRGPAGEPVTFERRGVVGRPETGLVDRYELRYADAPEPLIVYVDSYHFTDTLLAPRGLTCGAPFGLGVPPPDPFVAQEQLQELASESAKEKGFLAPPMELGRPPAVLIVDGFRQMAFAARAKAREGRPAAAAPGAGTKPAAQTAVIAYPWTCGDKTIAPTGVGLSDRRGGSMTPTSTTSEPDAVRALAAGAPTPAGSMAGVFPMPRLEPGLAVTVAYAEPSCAGVPPPDAFEITGSAAELLDHPPPTRPAGDPAIGRWVALHAILDEFGTFRTVRPMGGPTDLAAAAVTALSAWRALPARLNGQPIPTPVTLQVRFEAADPK